MTRRVQWILVFSVVMTAAACAQTAPRVRPGIDVLLTDSASLVAGRRVGLITNLTGVDSRGVPTIDRLLHPAPAQGTQPPRLVALFAPEHHFAASLRPGETFGDTVDAATGLPIYSLYGERRAPTAAQLATLDVLVVDLQDVGARTFTYVSTMVLAMRAAHAAGKRVLVLDRPNPIGCAVQGPVLDTAHASFIGMLPVPLRHGMTIGELARFANTELRIGADLVVVPVQGWTRCMWFDQTGLPWVPPSPNLPDLHALEWYPGTVLFEATNLSVGRGTDAPFRQVGAPWLLADTTTLSSASRAIARPVSFTPREPGDGKFPGVEVQGFRFEGSGRDRDVVSDALRLLVELAARYPELTADSVGVVRRLGVPFDPRRPAPAAAGDPAAIEAFRRRAQPYLLYR